jgi:hydrogenase maturation protease
MRYSAGKSLMPQLLLIGYGNPLRGDDGVGWVAAEILSQQYPAATTLLRHQLTPELAETMSQFEQVLFVDATAVGIPGQITCHPLAPHNEGGELFSHTCNPSSLLHMAQALYGRAPTAHLFTVAGASFGYEETLSPAVTAALPQLCAEIEKIVRDRV